MIIPKPTSAALDAESSACLRVDSKEEQVIDQKKLSAMLGSEIVGDVKVGHGQIEARQTLHSVRQLEAVQQLGKRLTPAQALKHFKALWPETDRIERREGGFVLRWYGDLATLESTPIIDWPDGVNEWQQQPQWETPVLPFDWGKECEFSDDGDVFEQSTLSQYAKNDESDKYVWCSASRYYAFCRIDRNRYPVPLPGAPESAQ